MTQIRVSKIILEHIQNCISGAPYIRGYREALDGRLCRPDSEGRPLISNLTTVAIVKLCCHNFTQIANFVIFFVSSISYRPTDLSLLKEFSKNVTF